MVKKSCVVSGNGQKQDFDLLSDDQAEAESPKTKMMLKAANKAGGATGSRNARGK
jgi:hypothetical protein